MDIKMLATDLDRTLLDGRHEPTPENASALEACAAKGIVLTAATGRALTAVPPAVRAIKGMRYVICSNGSKVYDNERTALLDAHYVSPEAIEYTRPFLADPEVLIEYFWDDTPHVDAERYERHEAIPDWFLGYFLASRKPHRDIAADVQAHIHEIENVNFVFGTEAQRARVHRFLAARPDLYELTSSMPFNFEIGGVGVSKASALDFVCAREGIAPKDCICFGDSENDARMIAWAGFGVAMGNAVPEAKAAADFVTLDNEHSGVAHALHTLGIL